MKDVACILQVIPRWPIVAALTALRQLEAHIEQTVSTSWMLVVCLSLEHGPVFPAVAASGRVVCLHRIFEVGWVAAAEEVEGVVHVPLAADRLAVVVAAFEHHALEAVREGVEAA